MEIDQALDLWDQLAMSALLYGDGTGRTGGGLMAIMGVKTMDEADVIEVGPQDRTQEMLQEMTRIRLRDELAKGCEAWALAPMAKVMNERGMTRLRVFRVALLSDTAYTVH